LVGVTITQAGEGLKAGVSLQRRWPLAKEARDVDLYREVAVRNMNATPVLAPVMYYFDTYGFAAFNHFLLYGNQKKVTGFHDDHPGYAMAYDTSLTDFLSQLLLAVSSDEAEAFCSDAAAGAVESAVIRVLTFGDGPLAKTLNPLGVAVGWIAGKIAGSMAAGLCPKLAADYDFSPVLAKKLYTNNHSTATRADFHGRLIKDLRWHPVDNLGSAGASLFRQSSNALDYDLLINNRTNLLSPQVHPITLCYEDSIACAQQTNTSYSALAQSLCPSGRCASMDPTLFKRCSYRNNPLSYYFDQGGAAGLYAVIARRCNDGSKAACRLLDGKPIHSCPAPFSVNGRVLLRCLDRGSDLYLSLSATPKDAAESFSEALPYQAGDRYQCKVAKGFRLPPFVPRRCANQGCYEYYTDFWRYTKDQWPEACTVDTQPRPFQRAPETCMSELVAILAKAGGTRQGVLLHLGRLIHAASDAAQPGHVTGELNGTEHTAMEGYAEQNVAYNFAGHQEQEIEVQDHVVTVPAYKKDLTSTGTVNARYALSYLVDPQEADFWISQWKEEYIDQQDSTEHIFEAIAREAKLRVKNHKDAKTVFFVADPAQAQNLKEQATKVTRDYLTLALVGNVIAMTRAMQMHFGAKWSSMVSKVSWTAADEDLPAKAGTPVALDMPLADMLRSYGVSSSTFSPYVEYAYQEKTFHDVCYISTHNWCTSHRGMGRPCVLPDCRKVACTAGTDCPPCQWHYQARSFEPPGNALPFVGPVVRVTLSRHNKGKGDDYKVHIRSGSAKAQDSKCFCPRVCGQPRPGAPVRTSGPTKSWSRRAAPPHGRTPWSVRPTSTHCRLGALRPAIPPSAASFPGEL
jgi:hypothetical protein